MTWLWTTVARKASAVQTIANTAARNSGAVVVAIVDRACDPGHTLDLADDERVLQALEAADRHPGPGRAPPPPLNLVLHVQGCKFGPLSQIALAISHYRGPVTVLVPYMSLSAGTVLALAADTIVMGRDAVLGPVNPVVPMPGSVATWTRFVSSADLIEADDERAALHNKPTSTADEEVLLAAVYSRKAVAAMRSLVLRVMLARGAYTAATANRAVERLVGGAVPHDSVVSREDAVDTLGLNVSLHENVPHWARSLVDEAISDRETPCRDPTQVIVALPNRPNQPPPPRDAQFA